MADCRLVIGDFAIDDLGLTILIDDFIDDFD
jgi:hypothetical protein